jgi:phage tail tape-measure protein
MSSNLKLKLMLDAFDNVSGPLKTIVKGSRKTSKQLRAQQGTMRALQRQQNDITSFQRLRTATRGIKKDFDSAAEKTEALKNQIDRVGVPTKALIRKFELAAKASDKLEQKYKTSARSLRKLKGGLKATGINTRNLTREQQRLGGEVDTASDAIDKQKRRLSALAKVQSRANNISAASGKVLNRSGNLAKKGIVAAGVGGYFFKTQLLDTAAEFENYEAVLKVVEGTSAKARKALDWSSTFAAKTPFELNAITEAYVKLRTYGLSPTNGLLQTLGDTSAAMNKPLLQSVEAIADAITGENERLKEFGIKARQAGGKITYEYTDRNDKQQSLTVDGNDRKAIENTLKTIWNSKFKGAMLERSKTWSGMISNMSDQWIRFSNMIMSNGLFDWMKAKLGGLLEKINTMAADGTLQKYASEWGKKFTVFAQGVWDLGSALVSATTTMADMVGGGKNLVMVLAGISLAPLIASVVTLAIALGPVGLTVAAIVAGIALIAANWDKIGNSSNTGTASRSRRAQRKKTANRAALKSVDAVSGATKTVIEQINIHATPGMDETQLAEKVAVAIDNHERKKRTRRRSRMRDND